MKLPLTLAAIAAIVAPALAADAWYTDFAAAQAQAKAENKSIVLDFTGSDWCGWCMTMRRMVLDTPAFYDYARDKFVLMEVDLPRNTSKMNAEQLRQNNELVKRYNITTYPTVLVISPSGDLIGGFTGGRTELTAVAQALDLANTNATLLRQAEEQSGVAKAQTLKTFYWNMPGAFRKGMSDLRSQIADLDPQNATGMHTEIQDLATVQGVTAQVRGMKHDAAVESILAAIDTVSATHRNDLLQLLADKLNERIQQLREQADSLEDIEAIRQANLTFIEYCLPKESHRHANSRLKAEFANPQEMLEELRQERDARTKYKKK
ncbi:MAG: thioredoxin family protein [Akkermansia sp.]|nr:thioredoxin family protein [Akkermansia sp.]